MVPIIRLLLQYGKEEVSIKKEAEEKDKEVEEITVSVGKYLVSAIKADDLGFISAVYQMIFDEYHRLLTLGEQPGENDFISHEMDQIRITAVDLLSSRYELSENWEKRRIIVNTEENKLSVLVDSSLLSFKIKKIESRIAEIQQTLKDTPDTEDMDILLMEMRNLKNISRKFNKDLSRIITH